MGGGSSRNGGLGEIVEVQGGHIVRSTGRKDRHSKVCTAKGPRDRRVRLAAHTAIQFYDVQDRLGYDRPSKAVDWLIKKAKSAIDELDELPPWKPTAAAPTGKSKAAASPEMYVGDNGDGSSSLLPPSLDSDAIADTIKSFFPMGGGGSSAVSSAADAAVGVQSMQYSNYPPPDLLPRRTGSHSQDLKLSLQSFQDPILHSQIGFDNPSTGWNPAGANGDGGGFMFMPPQASQLYGHGGHFFSQRGPLQSSNTPAIRAWIGDNGVGSATSHDYHQAISLAGIGYANSSGYSGFHIPARIQGDDEDHDDGNHNKPSSASSGSRH